MADSRIVGFHLHVHGPEGGGISTSFEAAEKRLVDDVQVYFEPDGSFVWASKGGKEQIFGMLYDARNQLQFVELRGRTARDSLRRVLLAIGGAELLGALTFKPLIGPSAGSGWQDLQTFEETTFGDPPTD